MKKIIGISHSGDAKEGVYRIGEEYVRSLTDAGAMPVILTPAHSKEEIDQLLDMCDGILLSGGPDYDPSLYGEEKLADCGEVSAERDAFEILLTKAALERGMPVLAICRGIQTLNVACGGSLWQDIPSQIEGAIHHSTYGDGVNAIHNVKISDDGIFDKIDFGEKCFEVNSFHHQALKRLADRLTVFAISEQDGVIEGAYDKNAKFTVGVQWHPERLSDRDENAKAIFRAFVEAL